jgi:hypothetical protein
MANLVEVKPTAWGNLILELAEATSDGTMPATLDQLGWVHEGSVATNVDTGTTLQLFETGHILRDEKDQEPVINYTMDIIGIPEAMVTKFWDATVSGSGDTERIAIKSFVNSLKYAIRISTPSVPGSDTWEAPYCKVNMSAPNWAEETGWMSTLSITVLKPTNDIYAYIGKVPTVPAG